MNDQTLNDLKQFITTTVHQEVSGLETKMDARFDENDKKFVAINARFDAIDARFDAMDARFDDNDTMQNEILNAIGEAQELQGKAIRYQAAHLDDHEQRIVKLEKRAA